MASGSKICPHCGALNGRDSASCVRCGARFPGPVGSALSGMWVAALGQETPITRLAALLCLLTFGLALLYGVDFAFMGGVTPSQALRWGALTAQAADTEIWRLLSAMFVHFGALHLAFNILGLADLGKSTEPLFGSSRFTLILLGGVIAGFGLSHVYFTAARLPYVTGGISGGLFSLMGAAIGYKFARRDPEWKRMLIRLLIYSVLFALMLPMNNAAHLGGFLFGAALGYFFQKENRPWRLEPAFRILAALLVLGAVTSPFLANASDTWRIQKAREIQREGYTLDPGSLRR